MPSWPWYTKACRQDVDRLLAKGGGLTAYRSTPTRDPGPTAGSWAQQLERLAAATADVTHAIATNSGTMALQAGLWALGLEPGRRIVTSPFTFSATVAAILHAGHQPVFGDVDPETYTLDPTRVPAGDVYLPVDLFGLRASRDFPGLVVADACQAADADITLSPALWATWSMNGHKNIPAGEAGLLLTNRDDLADRARRFISHGENWDDGMKVVGVNGRLNEVTACVAYHGLLDLSARNRERRRLAMTLWNELQKHCQARLLPLPPHQIARHALYVYPLRVQRGVDRSVYVQRLNSAGIPATEGYIVPHLGHYQAFKQIPRNWLHVVEELSTQTLVILTGLQPGLNLALIPQWAKTLVGALDRAMPRLRGSQKDQSWV